MKSLVLVSLIGLLFVIVAWKIIKFAIKILIVAIAVFIIFIGLDYFQVFEKIQGVISLIFNCL